MSVLINGMRLPSDCAACRFSIPVSERCLINYKNLSAENNSKRHIDCPLVDVPENTVIAVHDGEFYKVYGLRVELTT